MIDDLIQLAAKARKMGNEYLARQLEALAGGATKSVKNEKKTDKPFKEVSISELTAKLGQKKSTGGAVHGTATAKRVHRNEPLNKNHIGIEGSREEFCAKIVELDELAATLDYFTSFKELKAAAKASDIKINYNLAVDEFYEELKRICVELLENTK